MKTDRLFWTLVAGAGALSIILNVVTITRLRALQQLSTPTRFCQSGSSDDSKYSYVGEDHPTELPLQLDTVALKVENSKRYSASQMEAWAEWELLDYFKAGPNNTAMHGFVKLGGNGQMFGVSMFHQFHCLNMLRMAIIGEDPEPTSHTHHCLNFLRQMILCASDTTLDPLDYTEDGTLTGTDGLGVTHICRDWTQVFDYIHENQRGWS